jgi:succinylglutamate desuccinylase
MEITKDFIIGLIEGEGCFNITKSISVKNYKCKGTNEIKNYYSNVIQFKMDMHIRDYEMLKKIEKFIGTGKVYRVTTKYKRKPYLIASYVIAHRKSRRKLIDFIDSSCGFQGHKKIQYEKWKAFSNSRN